MDLSTIGLIFAAVSALLWSFYKDKDKTKRSLKIAKGQFLNIAVDIVSILALIGLFFAVVPNGLIKSFMGGGSYLTSTFFGALFGTVTIIPAFVAFPLSASLVDSGAYLVAVAAFITTLTMVGFATAPIEIKHFGKKFTLIRNVASFLVAILIAVGMVILL